MNKKQLICMWCGVGLIVLVGFESFMYLSERGFDGPGGISALAAECCRFGLWVFIVALVTGGLIYSLKYKGQQVKQQQSAQDGARKPTNIRRGFRRLTLVVSVIIPLVFFGVAIAAFLDGFPDDAVMFFVAGLLSFVVIWVLYSIVGWAIVPIVRWVSNGFHEDTG